MPALDIAIRQARPDDAAAIAAVHEAAWLEAYRGILPARTLAKMLARRSPEAWRRALRRGEAMLVLEVGETLAGYASYGPARGFGFGARGEIFELYLEPAHQGLGFGRRLFEAGRTELARRGYPHLVVWALAENERACAFYRRMGGRTVRKLRDRYEDRLVDRLAFVWD